MKPPKPDPFGQRTGQGQAKGGGGFTFPVAGIYVDVTLHN